MVKPDKNRFFLLIASFLISIFLYVYIAGEESIEMERNVVLTIIAPEGMTVIGGTERQVKVLLSAPRNIISVMGKEELTARYVLSDLADPGKYTFDLQEKDIRIPQHGVKIVDITPNRLTITVDVVVTKKLLVNAKVVGEPAKGHIVDYDTIFIDPTAALVKGPQTILSQTEKISTDPIDVVGRVRSFRIRVPLESSSQYEIESNELIDVMIPIKPQGFERVFELVPINVMHAAIKNFSVTIEPAAVDVSLKGPKNTLEKLDKKNVLAYVNVSELSRGEYQLPLMLTVPSEVSLVGDVPVIKVTIEDSLEKLNVVSQRPSEMTAQEEAQ